MSTVATLVIFPLDLAATIDASPIEISPNMFTEQASPFFEPVDAAEFDRGSVTLVKSDPFPVPEKNPVEAQETDRTAKDRVKSNRILFLIFIRR